MSIFARFRQAHRRRQAARQLREMESYLLRDIGIEPGQIDEAVAGMLARNEAEEQRTAPRQAPKPAPDAVPFEAPVFSKGEWPYSHRRAA